MASIDTRYQSNAAFWHVVHDWVMMTFLSEHSTLTESLGEVTDMRSDMGDWNQVIVSLILNTPSYLFTIKSDNWVTEAKKKKKSL